MLRDCFRPEATTWCLLRRFGIWVCTMLRGLISPISRNNKIRDLKSRVSFVTDICGMIYLYIIQEV